MIPGCQLNSRIQFDLKYFFSGSKNGMFIALMANASQLNNFDEQ